MSGTFLVNRNKKKNLKTKQNKTFAARHKKTETITKIK